MMTLAQIVEQLRWCEYECVGGMLVDNVAFRDLDAMAANQTPIDDLEVVIVRYTFLVERGQDATLDRVNAWLDLVKPLSFAR